MIATLVRRPPARVAPAAALVGVEKRFGRVEALRGVDLDLPRGEVVALLGPNGAGKTTALRILLGLRRPDAGRATLFGRDPREPAARRRCGATPQETSLPGTLTVTEIVELVRAHYAEPVPLDRLLDRFGIAHLAHRQAGGLSGGQRRRVALALAFAGAPELVVLDEPTTGLDAESRRRIWQEIRAHAADGTGTVLLTTHYLDEAEALATRVVAIARGRVVSEGTVAEIRARAGLVRVRVAAHGLPAVPGVVRRERDAHATTLYVHDAGEVVRALALAGAPLDGLEVTPVSLEEALAPRTESP